MKLNKIILITVFSVLGALGIVMSILTVTGNTAAKTTPVYTGAYGDVAIVNETLTLRKCSDYVSEGELTVRLNLNDNGLESYKKILGTKEDIIRVDIDCAYILTGDKNSVVKMKEFIGMTADGKYIRKSLTGLPEGQWCNTQRDPEWKDVIDKIREMKGMMK